MTEVLVALNLARAQQLENFPIHWMGYAAVGRVVFISIFMLSFLVMLEFTFVYIWRKYQKIQMGPTMSQELALCGFG